MRYTCSCRPAGASPTQVCMLSVAARVSPECHLKALSRVTWWLTRPSVRSRVVTGGDQIWVTTLVPHSDQWELATDHRDLSGSDTFSLNHHLWRHCPVLTLCSRRGTESSTGRHRRRTAPLKLSWATVLFCAVLCCAPSSPSSSPLYCKILSPALRLSFLLSPDWRSSWQLSLPGRVPCQDPRNRPCYNYHNWCFHFSTPAVFRYLNFDFYGSPYFICECVEAPYVFVCVLVCLCVTVRTPLCKRIV